MNFQSALKIGVPEIDPRVTSHEQKFYILGKNQ